MNDITHTALAVAVGVGLYQLRAALAGRGGNASSRASTAGPGAAVGVRRAGRVIRSGDAQDAGGTIGGSAPHRVEPTRLLDRLTHLFNRRALEGDLARMAPDELAVLLYVSLDGFRRVNDRHGMQVGNEYLVARAQAIRRIVPESHCYRVGGDEFAVLLRGAEDTGRALAIAEELRAEVELSVSIGDTTDELEERRWALERITATAHPRRPRATATVVVVYGRGPAEFSELEATIFNALDRGKSAGGNRVVEVRKP